MGAMVSGRRAGRTAVAALAAVAVAAPEGPGDSLPSLLWMAPALNAGGYSSEALSFALALEKEYSAARARFGLRQFAEQASPGFTRGLPEKMGPVLQDLLGAGRKKKWDVVVCHATPDVWHADGAFGWGSVQPCPPKGARFRVGRTMYETDRLPANWVQRINAMDEIWVPSAWAVEQFASSGIDKDKIVVMPEAVDTELFDPSRHTPLDQGGEDQGLFRFLSVFKWEKRKGWDLLLRAYFEEFSAEDPVVLRVKTQAFHTDGDFEAKVQSFVATLDAARRPLARHALISEDLPLRDMPRLYRGADAVVLPTRGEGWGRPHVEAMAMGLPVIATNWSGPTEFMSDAYALPLQIDGLVDVEEGQAPAGHRWAQPSVAHLRQLMRWAADHRAEAAVLGAKAREAMLERFSPGALARGHLLPRLRRLRRLLTEEGRGEL